MLLRLLAAVVCVETLSEPNEFSDYETFAIGIERRIEWREQRVGRAFERSGPARFLLDFNYY